MGLTLTWASSPYRNPRCEEEASWEAPSKAEGTRACGVPTPCGGKSSTARGLRFNAIARLPGLESFELLYFSLPCSPHL